MEAAFLLPPGRIFMRKNSMKTLAWMIAMLMFGIISIAQEPVIQDNIILAHTIIPKTVGLSTALAVYPPNNMGATVLANNTIMLFSLQDGADLKSIPNQEKPIQVIAFQPDGRTLATGDNEGNILLWTIPSGDIIFRMTKHVRAIKCLTFSGDGQFLASSADDLNILVWSVTSGLLVYQLQGHAQSATALFFSPEQDHITSISPDGTVRIWDTPKLVKQENKAPIADTPAALAQQGNYYRSRQEFDTAIEMYKKAIASDLQNPENIEYIYDLALALSLRAATQKDNEAKNKDIAETLQCLNQCFVKELKRWDTVMKDFAGTPTANEARFIQLYNEKKPSAVGDGPIGLSKKVSFDILEEGGKNKITALTILINGKEITPETLILPGSYYDVEVRFKDHETVKRQIYFELGKEEFILTLPLKSLRKFEIMFSKVDLNALVDGIKYPLKLYVDGQEIEPHLIESPKTDKSIMVPFTIRVSRDSRVFRAEMGYNYYESEFYALRSVIKLIRLDPKLLQAHLTTIARNHPEKYRGALCVLELLLRNPTDSNRVRSLPMAQLDELYNFVGEWNFQNPNDRERHRLLLDVLQEIVNKAISRDQ